MRTKPLGNQRLLHKKIQKALRALTPVPGRRNKAIIKIRKLGGNAKLYEDGVGRVFAVQSWRIKPGEKKWNVAVNKLGREKLEEHAIADFEIGPKGLEISELTKGLQEWKKHKGQFLFRAILSEAKMIAWQEKVDIWIGLDCSDLAEYYKQFGFKFNDPKNPEIGILKLRKKERK